jgi:beta-ribofuranosylaminobenzene 5'-phosphate synthase
VIRISAPSRLHFGLLNLSGIADRKYGGIGLALDAPVTEVEVSLAKSTSVSGELTEDQEHALRCLCSTMLSSKRRTKIVVRQSPPPHHGYGSKTALLLSVAAGLNKLWTLGYADGDLIRITGRGGTSGVGVWAFFRGGMIVDAGHAVGQSLQFLPSRGQLPLNPPLLVARYPVSRRWRIATLHFEEASLGGAQEQEFFSNNTPLERHESLSTIAIAHHGIVPAFLERDLAALRFNLIELHQVGFKARELAVQLPNVCACLGRLWTIEGAASGMSSLGPLLFSVYDHDHEVTLAPIFQSIAAEFGARLQITTIRNHGVRICSEQA